MNRIKLLICCMSSISVAMCSENVKKLTYDILNQSLCDLQVISWKVIATNAIELADDSSFIRNKMYHDSILNVIGKAITDCLNQKNEFVNLDDKRVIKFANQNYSEYTVENWNAVVLYNLIAAVLNIKFRRNIADCFYIYDLENFIAKEYDLKNQDEIKKLHKACSDIFEYDKELHIIDTLERYTKHCPYYGKYVDRTKTKTTDNTDMYYSYIEPKTKKYYAQIVPYIFLEKRGTVFNTTYGKPGLEKTPNVGLFLQWYKSKWQNKPEWHIKYIQLNDIFVNTVRMSYLYLEKDKLIDKIDRRLKMLDFECEREEIENIIDKEKIAIS